MRDGSAISRSPITGWANVLVDQGNLPEALKAYRDSLAIAERLAQADPGNAGWQRDLWVSYNKVGEILMAQGDLSRRLEEHNAPASQGRRVDSTWPGSRQ